MTEGTRQPTKQLYHYTDSAGLLGVLAQPEKFKGSPDGMTFGTLWATDANYLNDSEEVTFGSAILADEFEKQARAPHLPDGLVAQLTELANDIRKNHFNMTWHAEAQQAVPYVACLCENGDLLSQWRGYGAGGGGYAIGFHPDTLASFYTIDTDLIELATEFPIAATRLLGGPQKVTYGDTAARAFLSSFARESVTMDLFMSVEEDYLDVIRLSALKALSTVKHQAFSEEAEWRFIAHDAGMGNAEFRSGGIGLIPYMKLYFPITTGDHGEPPITEIVVGPGGNRELRRTALERLLRKIGAPDTTVRLSKAPFRG